MWENVLDFIMVVIAFVDLFLEFGGNHPNAQPFLRSLRVLWIWKLSKHFALLRNVLVVAVNTAAALTKLFVVSAIATTSFALLGLILFKSSYLNFACEDGPNACVQMPRRNFIDYCHRYGRKTLRIIQDVISNRLFPSFVVVFHVLLGEWIEPMWDCIDRAGYICVPYFVLIFVLGYIVIFNLIVAIFLAKFGDGLLGM